MVITFFICVAVCIIVFSICALIDKLHERTIEYERDTKLQELDNKNSVECLRNDIDTIRTLIKEIPIDEMYDREIKTRLHTISIIVNKYAENEEINENDKPVEFEEI